MTEVAFRENLRGSVAIMVPAPLRPPPLRMEIVGLRRVVLRQCDSPVLLAEVEDDHAGVTVCRQRGYRSPVPPLRADDSRREPDWLHRFADHLTGSGCGPLHAGRWVLKQVGWPGEMLLSWPADYVDWWSGASPVIPLRPLSGADAARVKSYRRLLREGTLPPVLLWWVSGFDGWVILDGHDRAVAALAEGHRPVSIVLARGKDDRHQAEAIAATVQQHDRILAATHDPNGQVHQAFAEQLASVAARQPYDNVRTLAFAGPVRPEEWDRIMTAFSEDDPAPGRPHSR